MGTYIHDAVTVTTAAWRDGGLPDIDAFRDSLPEEFRQLVIGPVPSCFNGRVSYAFLPDGSKEGWPPSDQGDEYRARFAALFAQQDEDGATCDDTVHIRYGGDHRHDNAPEIRYTHGGHA